MRVVVIFVGMLGLIYCGFRAINFIPGFKGRGILLSATICRTGPRFLVSVAWSHILLVVVVDVGMLGLMLVRIGIWRHRGHRGDFLR